MQESYLWLFNIIDSVNNPFQLDCCHTLINLFRQKFTLEDDFGDYYDNLLKHIEAKDALLSV